MPSIPQSLLWISLVVLWLFVLVPMLINKRDTVRRTSDVALATRVLNSGAKSRLIKRSGPAAGHRHDPDWQRDDEFSGEFVEDYPDQVEERLAEQREAIKEYDDAVRDARMGTRVRSVVVVAAVTEQTRPSRTTSTSTSSTRTPVPCRSAAGVQASLFDPPQEEQRQPVAADVDAPRSQPEPEPDSPQPEPERVAEPVAEQFPDRPRRTRRRRVRVHRRHLGSGGRGGAADSDGLALASRQRRLETTTAAAVSARKYRFRKRVLTAMVGAHGAHRSAVVHREPDLWWACGAVAGVTVLYLGYLRRQTRIEEQVRRRRQQRMARVARFVEESTPRRMPEVDFDDFPTRLQRPGAVVLEIDDEDPVFEHLDEMAYSGSRYGLSRDLPRAAGQ